MLPDAASDPIPAPVAGACAGLACAACPRPGRCCTNFLLNMRGEEGDADPAAVLARLHSRPQPHEDGETRPLPFLPLWQHATGKWFWWCPKLTREGRCGDYDRRPSLCRAYQPGQDALCALFSPRQVDEMPPASLRPVPPIKEPAHAAV